MHLLKKNNRFLFIIVAIVLTFVIANQIRVLHGGTFVATVVYFRYLGYLLIGLLFFLIGVKFKIVVLHNLAMIAMVFTFLEILFYAILGSPIKENKSFDMPDFKTGDIQYNVGHLPSPDTTLNEILVVGGDTSFNVNYSIDKYHKRITPSYVKSSHDNDDEKEYALFFGCSIGFGYGLNDNQTIPYLYQLNGTINAYNFSYTGHGTNHVLARLTHQNIREQVNEKEGKAFYLFFWDHIARAVGTMKRYTHWLHFAPYYYLDGDSLIRRKMFKDGRPISSFIYENIYQSNILNYFEVDFPLSLRASHFDLVAEMVVQSKIQYQTQFDDDDFYIVLMPAYKKVKEDDFNYFKKALKQRGVSILDLTDIVNYGPKYTLKNNPHPNEYFNDLFTKAMFNSFK